EGLTAGPYVLRIGATRGHLAATRAVAFAVTPSPVLLTQEHAPELDAALAAAAAYVDAYEQRVTGIGAEEQYEQAVQRPGVVVPGGGLGARQPAGGATTTATATRKTRARVMT